MLHLLPFVFIASIDSASFERWTKFTGIAGVSGRSFNLVLFGTAATVVFSLIAQIGEQVDFLRFLPARGTPGKRAWWAAYLAAGPGWIIPGMLKLLAGSFLAFLAVEHFVPLPKAVEPTRCILSAFGYVFSSPQMALAFTGAFVIISQLKINVTNAYAGSIAWSNFFSRLTHSHPGRVVWLVFNVTIALMLMELGIFKMLEHMLGLYSIVAVSWVSALVADLVINKPLGLSPAGIEFKRAHLYDINPVGVGAMFAATVVGIAAFCGLLGTTLQSLSSFLALAVAFVMAPADRLGDARPLLYRPLAAAELERPRGDPLLDLRAPFRGRGHGALPGLFGSHLLAVLLARDALPRLLQAAGARLQSASRLVRRGIAGANRHASEHPCRPLSRRACRFLSA